MNHFEKRYIMLLAFLIGRIQQICRSIFQKALWEELQPAFSDTAIRVQPRVFFAPSVTN